ncbi:uncharacterized protein CLUP02_00634 [Colletotrichum lupini]|uniref:Uncharacterized protein n=1 Tax=Colletotrichum lupini TaxID=145971 RepID=A0A9Q8W8Y4_9PEZI|nr:uncharacterized protein CLUP02_00634 [Colletotrichum lupini]UQC73987.1 hypothetical protein CLUP02_00634 [Colletotrichum lupini]
MSEKSGKKQWRPSYVAFLPCLLAFQLIFLSVPEVNDRPMPLNEHSWDATICGISTSFSYRLTKISLQKTVPVVNRFLAFRGGRWQRLGIDHCLLLSKDPKDRRRATTSHGSQHQETHLGVWQYLQGSPAGASHPPSLFVCWLTIFALFLLRSLRSLNILSPVTVTLRAVSERKPHKPRDIPGCLQQIQNCPDQPNQANSPFLRPQRHQTRPCLLRWAQPPVTTWSAGVTRDGDATGAAPFTWRQDVLPMTSQRILVATFGKMGTIQPLLRGVPLFSDSNLDLYITLEFAPIHEATNCWPDLSRAIALVILQLSFTQQVSSKSLIRSHIQRSALSSHLTPSPGFDKTDRVYRNRA